MSLKNELILIQFYSFTLKQFIVIIYFNDFSYKIKKGMHNAEEEDSMNAMYALSLLKLIYEISSTKDQQLF